jgi:hypothetical protein
MALIVRIDVDRPYGKQPVFRHVLSRMSSDLCFPNINAFGYLRELEVMLRILTERGAHAYVFFRRCTMPSPSVLRLLEIGGHEAGLHLEDSRSFRTFLEERNNLERHLGKKVLAVSKHGSGGAKYGYHHHAPYEPDRYVAWARQAGMRLFLGNLEDPFLEPEHDGDRFTSFPSAFWLEPHWRDLERFTVEDLVCRAKERDIVLLVHPENVLENPELAGTFAGLASDMETKILP